MFLEHVYLKIAAGSGKSIPMPLGLLISVTLISALEKQYPNYGYRKAIPLTGKPASGKGEVHFM
jgi:hypothetical protein